MLKSGLCRGWEMETRSRSTAQVEVSSTSPSLHSFIPTRFHR